MGQTLLSDVRSRERPLLGQQAEVGWQGCVLPLAPTAVIRSAASARRQSTPNRTLLVGIATGRTAPG